MKIVITIRPFWVALGCEYKVSSLIDLGINFRHWETEKERIKLGFSMAICKNKGF